MTTRKHFAEKLPETLDAPRRWVSGVFARLNNRREVADLRARVAELESALAAADEQIAAQRRNLETLLTISEATGGNVPLDQIFYHVLQKVFETTGYDAGAIRLLDRERRSFSLVAQQGMNLRMLQDLQHVPVDQAFQAEVARTLQPVYTNNLPCDPRVLSPGEVESGYQCLICVPLLASDRLVGTMELATVEQHVWDEDEIRWLTSIGRQIGAAIHLVQLSEQSRDLAILQERERLSQELHDGLAQVIGTIRLRAEEAALCLEDGDCDSARATLEDIEQIAQDAYASIRDDILGLRLTAVPQEGLVPLMMEYFSRFQRQWGIQVLFCGREHNGCLASPAAEIQLIRIIQEAMTNVRRHAQASRVAIRFEDSDEMLRVTIEDNGRGFDPNKVEGARFGLRIMRERAASVGGRLTIETQPGEGTRVIAEMPRYRSYNTCRERDPLTQPG
ncbi:MAG: GAF domain-containing sensor histidine kinase [Aggregatilineales bacterium]|nr:GAF domain-containing sensor histidine kinase [Aggregatilineales bacterium]HPV06747.1 GAF domain-containing sensor histidine kinase [Aggregatilineales bacterium]HQE17874.1 GAF domain-containing sensor histidine kinase [Aggregatilineales bacterium]